jgi:hypothetical protein
VRELKKSSIRNVPNDHQAHVLLGKITVICVHRMSLIVCQALAKHFKII